MHRIGRKPSFSEEASLHSQEHCPSPSIVKPLFNLKSSGDLLKGGGGGEGGGGRQLSDQVLRESSHDLENLRGESMQFENHKYWGRIGALMGALDMGQKYWNFL